MNLEISLKSQTKRQGVSYCFAVSVEKCGKKKKFSRYSVTTFAVMGIGFTSLPLSLQVQLGNLFHCHVTDRKGESPAHGGFSCGGDRGEFSLRSLGGTRGV